MASLPDGPKQTRVFLWCWPRSISTALEKCLSFVDGVQVWHEPYQIAVIAETIREVAQSTPERMNLPTVQSYVEYMKSTQGGNNYEFSGGNLMPSRNFTFPWIKSELEKEEPGKEYIIIKDTAWAIYGHTDALPVVPTRHTFLIRHPYLTMTSYRKAHMRTSNHTGDPADFELPSLLEEYFLNADYMRLLWRDVQESGREPSPIIIEAEELMNYPEKILPRYLGALGIPYRDSYTSWEASEASIKTWRGGLEYLNYGKQVGLFAKAFASSCFLPETHVMPKREDLTPDIERIIDRIMPGYQEMHAHRIKPE